MLSSGPGVEAETPHRDTTPLAAAHSLLGARRGLQVLAVVQYWGLSITSSRKDGVTHRGPLSPKNLQEMRQCFHPSDLLLLEPCPLDGNAPRDRAEEMEQGRRGSEQVRDRGLQMNTYRHETVGVSHRQN